MSYCISHLQTMTVFGSSACEWLLCLGVFPASDDACSWLFRLWVAVATCWISSLLIMTVFGSSGCEWLLYIAKFQACWPWLSLALQTVGGCCALVNFKPADHDCLWLFSLWVAAVCALLDFKSADQDCLWLSSVWVTAVPWWISSLLTKTVFGSSVCEWLLCLARFQVCWPRLSLALQCVSDCCALVNFKPADHDCLWLFSMWVAAVPFQISNLLIKPVLGSSAGKWLLCPTMFHASDDACLWLFRGWVAFVPYISSLLIKPILGSPESEWLLCCAVVHAC